MKKMTVLDKNRCSYTTLSGNNSLSCCYGKTWCWNHC